jgi:hypothetical protein
VCLKRILQPSRKGELNRNAELSMLSMYTCSMGCQDDHDCRCQRVENVAIPGRALTATLVHRFRGASTLTVEDRTDPDEM